MSHWPLILSAAAILMITMGARQSLGLFISPLNTATGLGIRAISFAMAVAQFVWGAAQPVARAVADRYGPGRVLAFGVVVMALGFALTPFMANQWGLVFHHRAAQRGRFGGGQLFGADRSRCAAAQPAVARHGIGRHQCGWVVRPVRLRSLAAAPDLGFRLGWRDVLAGLISSPRCRSRARCAAAQARTKPRTSPRVAGPQHGQGLAGGAAPAIADRSYLLLHAGFFTCGFHIAFLVTHLPGEVQLCGLPAQVASWSLALIGLSNIAGSLAAGWAVQRYRSKYVLAWMYGSRALLVALYLMAPKTAMTFYIFAVGLGLTWLATVPPTAGVVGKLFGTRYLGTLFGLTLLSHQIGGFLGAWLGGIAIIQTGDYNWMWYADMALAAAAALCNLPIREAGCARRSSPPERGEFAFARARRWPQSSAVAPRTKRNTAVGRPCASTSGRDQRGHPAASPGRRPGCDVLPGRRRPVSSPAPSVSKLIGASNHALDLGGVRCRGMVCGAHLP